MNRYLFLFLIFVLFVSGSAFAQGSPQESFVKTESFSCVSKDSTELSGTIYRNNSLNDKNVKIVRVWSQVYPETRKRVSQFALYDIKTVGDESPVIHVTFDFRGTGKSSGIKSESRIVEDLNTIKQYFLNRYGKNIDYKVLGHHAKRLCTEIKRIGFKDVVLYVNLYKTPKFSPKKSLIVFFGPLGEWTDNCDTLAFNLSQLGFPVIGINTSQFLISFKKTTVLSPENIAGKINGIISKSNLSGGITNKIIYMGEEFGANLILAAGILDPQMIKTIMINPLHINISEQKYFTGLLQNKYSGHFNGVDLLNNDERIFIYYNVPTIRSFAKIIQDHVKPGLPPNHTFLLRPEKRENSDAFLIRHFITQQFKKFRF